MSFIFFLLTTLVHDVQPTTFVKDGQLTITAKPMNSQTADVAIDYVLHMAPLAPSGDRSGTLHQDLPLSLFSEQGYIALEHAGQEEFNDLTLVARRPMDKDGYRGVHVAQILKHDHSLDTVVYYHPSVPSVGWVALDVTLHNVPGVGDYTIHSHLRKGGVSSDDGVPFDLTPGL